MTYTASVNKCEVNNTNKDSIKADIDNKLKNISGSGSFS